MEDGSFTTYYKWKCGDDTHCWERTDKFGAKDKLLTFGFVCSCDDLVDVQKTYVENFCEDKSHKDKQLFFVDVHYKWHHPDCGETERWSRKVGVYARDKQMAFGVVCQEQDLIDIAATYEANFKN